MNERASERMGVEYIENEAKKIIINRAINGKLYGQMGFCPVITRLCCIYLTISWNLELRCTCQIESHSLVHTQCSRVRLCAHTTKRITKKHIKHHIIINAPIDYKAKGHSNQLNACLVCAVCTVHVANFPIMITSVNTNPRTVQWTHSQQRQIEKAAGFYAPFEIIRLTM